jgi:Glycosyl hydrolases family 18
MCLWWLICAFLFPGCSSATKPAAPGKLGAWLVYWAAESGLAELKAHGALFHQVSLFAYELDAAGNPRPGPGVTEIIPQFLQLAREKGFQPWVTVVNDVRYPDRKVLKDKQILENVLGDPRARLAQVRSLAAMVKENGFAGLTLDYEGLENRQAENYRDFVTELAQELAKGNLGLNVLVEPRRGPLPRSKTVRLTVMGYNLHGPHSGPGPRATPAFIASLGKRGTGDLQGSPAVAMAVGGFLWLQAGEVEKVSWRAAFEMAQGAAEVGRNSVDSCPFARWANHSEMWFEDPVSLQAKWQAARHAGYRDVWLWHLGDNDARLFDWLGQLPVSQPGL